MHDLIGPVSYQKRLEYSHKFEYTSTENLQIFKQEKQ